MSEEDKKKVSDRMLSYYKTHKHPMDGAKHTDESRKKISETRKKLGLKAPSRKGIPHTEEFKRAVSIRHTGRKDTDATRLKKLAVVPRGDKCHFWKGGVTPLRLLIKQNINYRQWRTKVFERDKYCCQHCGVIGGKLNADHIKSFSIILDEHNITSLADAVSCQELWDINNGRTLCEPCHRKTPNFGYYGRVSSQKTKSSPEEYRNAKYAKGWKESDHVRGWGTVEQVMKLIT